MKKAFKRIVVFSLIFCILVSIFNIGKVLADEPKFILSDASIVDKSDGIESTITSFNSDSLNTNTTFHKLNDYVQFKLTIKNTSSFKYKLKLVNDNSENNYIDYEYDYNQDEVLAPNKTIDIYIKAIYKNELDDANTRNQRDEFIISLILEDEEGNIDNESIIVNPNTNSDITFYEYLLVISIGLLLIIVIDVKKTKKIFITILVLSPLFVKAVSPSVTIDFVNNTNLYDKIVITKVVNGETTTEVIDYNTKIEKPEDPIRDGYNFLGWYVGDELYDFSKAVTEDTNITAKYSLIDYSITYNLDGGSVTGNPSTYNVETDSFDLVNPTKEGYSFSGWTEGSGDALQTRVTIYKGTTGNKTYTAHFKPGESTHYKVNHKYANLDGSYEVVEENLYGTTGTTVTPAFMPRTGFNNPDSQQLNILPNGSAEIDYIYTRKEYQLTINNIEDVDTTFENKKYPYETVITLTAKDKEHYNFVKWSNGVTTKTLSFEITEDTTVGPEYTPKEYTVTFDTQGGVEVNSITKKYNTEVGELPETLKNYYTFGGWYTSLDYTTKVTPTTKVLGDVTYYAKWEKIVLCKSATILHTEECTRTTGGCYQAGYREGSGNNTKTIVYGTIPDSDTLTPGYAYDCDVNGDKVYDSSTERFYYLTTNGDNAVLISHNDFEGENGQQNINNFAYDDIFNQLPTSNQWSNLPIKFNGKPARIPTYDELKAACGKNTLTTTGDLDRCPYLLENSRFADAEQSQDGVWLEKINGVTYRYHTNTRAVSSKTQVNTVRPAIEVPLVMMDDTFYTGVEKTVTFNSQGGVSVNPIKVDTNTAIGNLPITTKENYYFMGWYTSSTGGTRINANTIITDDVTYYAHWATEAVAEINGVYYSNLEDAIKEVPTDNTETTIKLLMNTSASLVTIEENQNIVFDLQNYTLSNSNTKAVLVNNGKIKINNGTLSSSGMEAVINNNSSGVLIVTGGNILATGTKQSIYNDGGFVEISGNAYLKATTNQRATLHNLNGGVMNIKGGTIISEKQQAVTNVGSSLVIGVKDNNHNTSTPILQGKTYGLTTDSNVSIYDGILKGETNAINNPGMINAHEDNFSLVNGIDGVYKTLYFE